MTTLLYMICPRNGTSAPQETCEQRYRSGAGLCRTDSL